MIYSKSLQVDIPLDLKNGLKAEAAKQGKSLKQLLTEIVSEYLADRK